MSEEFKIPPDLAILESKLRALPVASSGINRNELLYQAGWTAAMAAAMPAQPVTVHWFWPTASSVLATVAAVLAVVVYQQRIDVPSRFDNAAVATAPDSKQTDKAIRMDADHSLATTPWLDTDFETRMANSPLTTSSYRFDLHTEAARVLDTDLEAVKPKSTFELLREMVPRTETETRFEEPKPVWDWFSQKVGEII